MNFKLKFPWTIRTTVGLVIGILLPMIAAPLVMMLLAWAQDYPFAVFWKAFVQNPDPRSKMLSLSIIANLGVFYFFLNKERYDIARGIIIGSALYIPYILYLKFG